MSARPATLIAVVFVSLAFSFGQAPRSQIAHTFENQYVKMTVLPGWTVDTSVAALIKVLHGKYVLTIDPVLVHATAFGGLDTIAAALPSVQAVMSGVQGPWMTSCAQPQKMIETKKIELFPLYTDATKENIDYGCTFPADGKPAWFASCYLGEREGSEYIIALTYDSDDVNALPKKGTPELTRVLSEAARMMDSLEMQPPVVVSDIKPRTAPPGATVTLQGSGFELTNIRPSVQKLPNLSLPPARISEDGKSMSFEIPRSRTIISCDKPGYVDVDENCVPAPSNQSFVECPALNDRHPTFCGVPFSPGVYQIQVVGSMVRGNAVTLTVTDPKPTSVSISLLYPNTSILPGDNITVRGSGFTRTGNTIRIGDTAISDVGSPDGKTLTFEAPMPSGTSVSPGLSDFNASVANANGISNPILVGYRYSKADAVGANMIPVHNSGASPSKPQR